MPRVMIGRRAAAQGLRIFTSSVVPRIFISYAMRGTPIWWKTGRATLTHRIPAFQPLGRDSLTGLQGPLHVAAPDGGRLGARPVEAPIGLTQVRTAARPAARAKVRGRPAPRPLLSLPGLFGIGERLRSAGAVEALEAGEKRGAAVRRCQRRQLTRLGTADEAEQDAGGAVA